MLSLITKIIERHGLNNYGKVIMPKLLYIEKKHFVEVHLPDEYCWVKITDGSHWTTDAGSILTSRLLFVNNDNLKEQVSVWALALLQEIRYHSVYLRDGGQNWSAARHLLQRVWLDVKGDYSSWPYHHKSKGFPEGAIDLGRFVAPACAHELAWLLSMCMSHIANGWRPMKLTHTNV